MSRLNPNDIYAGIEAAAQKYGLPPEARRALHAIAKVESSYGRSNVGRAIGVEVSGDRTHQGQRAMGPFQFMPKTAKAYGLADPMDPYQSADAAARHLIDGYKRQGDWFKAAVGHHSGPAWKSLGRHGRDYVAKLQRELEAGIGVDDAYMQRVMGGQGVDRRMAYNAGPNDGAPPADWDVPVEDGVAFLEGLGLDLGSAQKSKAEPKAAPKADPVDDEGVAFLESLNLDLAPPKSTPKPALPAESPLASAPIPAPPEPPKTIMEKAVGTGSLMDKFTAPFVAAGGGAAGIAKGAIDMATGGAKVADTFMEPFGLGLGPLAEPGPVIPGFPIRDTLAELETRGQEVANDSWATKAGSMVPRALLGSSKVLKDSAMQGGLTFLERDDLPMEKRIGAAASDAVMAGTLGTAVKGIRSLLFGPNHLPKQTPGGATTPMENAEAVGAVPPLAVLRQDPHELSVAHRAAQQGLLGGKTFSKQIDQSVAAATTHALTKGYGVKLPAGVKPAADTDWSGPVKQRIRDLKVQQAALPPDQQWALDAPIRDLTKIKRSLTPNGTVNPPKLKNALANNKTGVPEATQAAKVLEDLAMPDLRFAAGNEVGVMMPKRAMRSVVGLLDNHSTLPEGQLFRALQAAGVPRRGALSSLPGGIGAVSRKYGQGVADKTHGAMRGYAMEEEDQPVGEGLLH